MHGSKNGEVIANWKQNQEDTSNTSSPEERNQRNVFFFNRIMLC